MKEKCVPSPRSAHVKIDCAAGLMSVAAAPADQQDPITLATPSDRLSRRATALTTGQLKADRETPLRDQLKISHDTGSRSRDGYAFEAMDQVQVIRRVKVDPFIKHLVDPDGMS